MDAKMRISSDAKRFFYTFLFLIMTLNKGLLAQGDASDKSIVALKLNEKVTIDGLLTEEIWNRPGFTEFYQQDPKPGEIPSQRTEVVGCL